MSDFMYLVRMHAGLVSSLCFVEPEQSVTGSSAREMGTVSTQSVPWAIVTLTQV